MKHIYSNQLSSALKSQYPKPFFFELANKNVKFNQSFHNYDRYSGFKLIKSPYKLKDDNEDMVQRSSLEAPTKDSKKVSYQQWSTIINKLKDEVYKIKTKNKQCNK